MYKHILVPIDGSSTSDRGLQEAIRLAGELKVKPNLRLLHVIDDYPMLWEASGISSLEASMAKVREFGDALLAKARATATMADIQAETVLREVTQGRIADVVLEEVRRAGCDLIVTGTHGRRGLSRIALGSDADSVMRSSVVPVLLVREAPQTV